MSEGSLATSHTFLRELWLICKYGLVGIGNTLFSTALIFIFSAVGFSFEIYTTIAYVAGMIVSFFLNYRLTFSSSGKDLHVRAFKFVIVSLTMLCLTQLVQHVLIRRIGMSETFGVILGMCTYTGGGYILNRLWVFGGRNS
jgi:putative flippase GtrA